MYWDMSFTVSLGLTPRLQTVFNRIVWKWENDFSKRHEGLLISRGLIFLPCLLLLNAVNEDGEIPPIFLTLVLLLLLYFFERP